MVKDETPDSVPYAGTLRDALFRFLGSLVDKIIISEHAVDAVALGVAHFSSEPQISELSEPLVFFNLIRWIRNSSKYSISGVVTRQLDRPSTDLHRSGFFPGVAAIFWHTLSTPTPFKNVVEFCSPVPSWATESVTLACFYEQAIAWLPTIRDTSSELSHLGSVRGFSNRCVRLVY